MLTSIEPAADRDDEGFTLIEIMVVLVIIAILLAIAIPTFLGARNTANARSSQENLRNALTAEQTYRASNQTFSATVSSMQAIEPALLWQTTAPAQGTIQVGVTLGNNTASGDTVFLQSYAKDGNCYTIEVTTDPAVTGVETTGYSSNTGACVAPSGTGLKFTNPAAGTAGANVGPAGAPSGYYKAF